MGDAKGDYKMEVDSPDEDATSTSSSAPAYPEAAGLTPNRPGVSIPYFVISPAARAAVPVLSYCFASILMTVTNKFVLNQYHFNLNLFLLAIQVCCRFLDCMVKKIDCSSV